jgi:hypothetical protein
MAIEWDSVNKKKVYRGKYFGQNLQAQGYYGTNIAGNVRHANPNDAGVKREFIGSGTKEYNFYSDTQGVLTVRADSYQEAWRIAKARGYKRRRRGK